MAVHKVNIDVVDQTSTNPIAVICVPQPCKNYAATAYEVKQLIQIAKYYVYKAGTNKIINGRNYYDYFPEERPGDGVSVLVSKDITENGTYNANDDSADGYSSVNVNVPDILGHTFVVTTIPNATVNVSNVSNSYSSIANANGEAMFESVVSGTYDVFAIYDDAVSDTTTITIADHTVTEDSFATLTISASENTTITLTNGTVTKTLVYEGTPVVQYVSLGTWDLSCTLDGTTVTRTVLVNSYSNNFINLRPNAIYGAVWDKTANAVGRNSWSRTDKAQNFSDPVPYTTQQQGSSPFDTCYPWSEMKIVTIDKRDYVLIPVYWYKITNTSTELKIQIANYAAEGFNVSPAHCDRRTGGEKTILHENIYVGRYKANGGIPAATGTKATFISSNNVLATADNDCANKGTSRMDFRTFWTINLLYLVEAASWDPIEGEGTQWGTDIAVGGTDAMPYHTGIMGETIASNAMSQWRHFEDFTKGGSEVIKGYFADGSGSVLKVYFASEDGNMSDYVSAPLVPNFKKEKLRDFISNNVAGYEWALVPSCTPPAESSAPETEGCGSHDIGYRMYNYDMNRLQYPLSYWRFGLTFMSSLADGYYRVVRFDN